MTCKNGDIKCRMKQGMVAAAVVIFVIVTLYIIGCGCFSKLIGPINWTTYSDKKPLSKLRLPSMNTSKCPTCKPTVCPPRTKCPRCAPCPTCDKCPKCTRPQTQKMCAHCGSVMNGDRCNKCAFELDANKYDQTSLHEKQSECVLCFSKPCRCVSKSGNHVNTEAGVSRSGVYSSCMDNMTFT